MVAQYVTRVALGAVITLVFAGGAAAGEAKVVDAAERQDRTRLSTMLKRGADVNAPQPDGATALHWATHWDDLSMVAELLQAGANPNAANDYGVRPLFLAATNGNAR